MDVVRLNSDTHIPDLLIDGYESMIFVERYEGLGEFELKTTRVRQTMLDLPFFSHLSILTSREIMIVETHEIETDEHGVTILTVSGRSYLNILEIRGLYLPVRGYHTPWPMLRPYTATDAVAVYMWNLLCNNTGRDVTHGSGRPPLNSMPNLAVSKRGDRPEVEQEWTVEEGIAWNYVQDLLTIGALSLRVIRPIPEPESFDIVSVNTSGVLSESTVSTKVTRIEVYQGQDRSEEIILRDDAGHYTKSKYLFSVKDNRNIAGVVYSTGRQIVEYPPGSNAGTSGFARRAAIIDGGQVGDDPVAFAKLMLQMGYAELAKSKRVALFEGDLNLAVPYKYGEDYELGDVVLAVAEYGLQIQMQVIEYIRSYDHTGEKEYPTLRPQGDPIILPPVDACVTYPPPYAVESTGESFSMISPPGKYPDFEPFTAYISVSGSPTTVWAKLVADGGYVNKKEANWNGETWVAQFPDWDPTINVAALYATNITESSFYTLTNIRICPGVDTPGLVCIDYAPPYTSPYPGWQDFENASIQPMMVYLTVEEDVDTDGQIYLAWETPYSSTQEEIMHFVDGKWTATVNFISPGAPGDMIAVAPWSGHLMGAGSGEMLTMSSLRVCFYTYDTPESCVVYEDPWEDQPYIENQEVMVNMPADSVEVFATIDGYMPVIYPGPDISPDIAAFGTYPNHYMGRVYIELTAPVSTLWIWTYYPSEMNDVREATGSGTSWYIDYPSWPGTLQWATMYMMPTSSTSGSTYYTAAELKLIPSFTEPDELYIRVVDPGFVNERYEAWAFGAEWKTILDLSNDILFMSVEDVDGNKMVITRLQVCALYEG